MEQGLCQLRAAACGSEQFQAALGVDRSRKRCQEPGQNWTNDRSNGLLPSHTRSSPHNARDPWVLGSCLTRRWALLLTGCRRRWRHPPQPPGVGLRLEGEGVQTTTGGAEVWPKLRARHPGPPCLCPLSPAPCSSRVKGLTLSKPQRKYSRPFWAPRSLRQSAFFTLKAAQNQPWLHFTAVGKEVSIAISPSL